MKKDVHAQIGPADPQFGSWNWIGTHLLQALPSHGIETSQFEREPDDSADIIVFIKFLPSVEQLAYLARRSKIVFLPVDIYGSGGEIEADRERLRWVDLIALHSERLARWFSGLCHVCVIDHPLKYSILPRPELGLKTIWVGRRCNLPPVVTWFNSQSVLKTLHILTNLETEGATVLNQFSAAKDVSVAEWSPKSHMELLGEARVALDIKADSFRARHKPPAKILDFICAGVPVITNRHSSSDLYLRQRKFQALYTDDWTSRFNIEYRVQLLEFAEHMRPLLDSPYVAEKFAEHLVQLLTRS